MRYLRVTAFVAVLFLGFAACGSDSDNTSASDTTAPLSSNTTIASRPTTTAARSGKSPCLTKEEIAALAGRAPDRVEERPNAGTGWPDGQCLVDWNDAAEFRLSFQLLSSEAAAEQRYDETVARYKANEYHEDVPCSGIGDECYISRGTGNDTFTGFSGLLYARQGSRTISSNYADAFLKLKPSREETIQLYKDLVSAHLAKVNAA